MITFITEELVKNQCQRIWNHGGQLFVKPSGLIYVARGNPPEEVSSIMVVALWQRGLIHAVSEQGRNMVLELTELGVKVGRLWASYSAIK